MLEWIARGQYMIGVGGSSTLSKQMEKKGVPLKQMIGSKLKEGTYLGVGAAGAVSVVEGAPHPNAAKVYLDWLLSKEGQTIWGRASGSASRRLDVPTDHLDAAKMREPGVQYLESFRESWLKVTPKAVQFAIPFIQQ